jgi:hypothetical protein
MSVPTSEELRSVEKRLIAAGVLRCEEGSFYDLYSADGKDLTLQEVAALCAAVLAKEAAEAVQKQAASAAREDKSKGGRPKKGDEKLKGISTMVSPVRHAQLHAAALDLGLSVSELVRPLVDPKGARGERRIGKIIRRGLSLEQRKGVRTLAATAASLDQLAKAAEAAGDVAHAAALVAMAKQIREVIKSLNK